MDHTASQFQPIIQRIVSAIEDGIEPQRLSAYMRDTGWFEVNGEELSESAFAGLLALATHQMTMQATDVRQSFKSRKDEIYSLSRSVAVAALMTGDLKNANAAIANMRDTAVSAPAQQAKAPKKPRDASIPDLSVEDVEKITNRPDRDSRDVEKENS